MQVPSRRRRSSGFAILAIAALAVPATATAKGKNHHAPTPPTVSAPIAQGLAGPLQLAVDRRSVYVSQAFAGLLTKIGPGGSTVVAANPGGEIAGVDVGRKHQVFYTSQNADATTGAVTASALNRIKRDGSSTLVRDILKYETKRNPDRNAQYGFTSIPADCAAQWPVDEAGPAQYTGIVDSHPYAVAIAGRHNFVADAAANAIFDISKSGHLRTVAVLPPQPAVVTAAAATANNLPACTVGLTYNFEPVPTDVEVGRDGYLYVTTLPGGVEDASLGARGSVYRINPWNGKTRRIATGLLGATNLALGSHGRIYVSELFANKISEIVHGTPRPLIDLPSPAGLEYANGKLYVGYDVFANGTLATINVGRAHKGHHGHRTAHFPKDRAAAKRLAHKLHL